MRTLIVAICLALAIPVLARAQSQITTGVIHGVVTDATAAALPGVTVEARNVDTNFTRSAVTGATAASRCCQLPPGRYTVTFTLAGFATLVQENVERHGRPDGHAAAPMKVSGRRGDGHRHRQPAVEMTRTRRGEHAQRDHHRARRRSSAASSRIC